MPDTQTIEPIELAYKEEHVPRATRNGNNVAWMCWCGSREPLLGGAMAGKTSRSIARTAARGTKCSLVRAGS